MKKSALLDLLALGEGFTTKFKRSDTSNLGREICAFANATGGAILIGVSDSGEIIGVDGHNKLKSDVQAIARSAEPPIEVSEHWFVVAFPRPALMEGKQDGQLGPVTPEVTPEVAPEARLCRIMRGEMSRADLQAALKLKDAEHFRKAYLIPALDAGYIEMTIPDKPRSSKQRYRLMDKGREFLAGLQE